MFTSFPKELPTRDQPPTNVPALTMTKDVTQWSDHTLHTCKKDVTWLLYCWTGTEESHSLGRLCHGRGSLGSTQTIKAGALVQQGLPSPLLLYFPLPGLSSVASLKVKQHVFFLLIHASKNLDLCKPPACLPPLNGPL